MVRVEATVGVPFQKTRMSSVSTPGFSRQSWAAISPVVYIWAMPGASSRPFSAIRWPYSSSQTISQSCSPVVSR